MAFARIQPVIRGGLVAFWLAAASSGQELDDLNALVPDSLAAMKAEHWEEALGLLTRATAMKPAAALRSFGPQFGVVWYRRGICELKLRRWEEAIHSFETCYRDYPNRGPSGGNLYQTKALLKWGEAAVGAKKWDLAIVRFRKFLDERDKVRDTFPQASFYITLGICHYRLGHLAEGNEQLEIAIRNRESFPTSDEQIVAGIQVLVGAAISGGNEQAMLDFLASNQAALAIEPHRACNFSTVYLTLAADAAAAKMNRAALALYQLTPDPGRVISELKTLATSGPAPEQAAWAQQLKRFEENERSETSSGLLKLAGLAGVQEALGGTQAACDLREQIQRDFPGSVMHHENLRRLNLLRFRLAEAAEAENKPDQAIAAYEKLWMDEECRSVLSARAVKRWMELLLHRNHEGDRLSACRGGISYLEVSRTSTTDLSDEDQAATEEVGKLTKRLQTEMAAEARSGP